MTVTIADPVRHTVQQILSWFAQGFEHTTESDMLAGLSDTKPKSLDELLGPQLIAQLGAIARDRGSEIVFVQADLDDPPAQALYAKLGEARPVLHFDIDVPQALDS